MFIWYFNMSIKFRVSCRFFCARFFIHFPFWKQSGVFQSERIGSCRFRYSKMLEKRIWEIKSRAISGLFGMCLKFSWLKNNWFHFISRFYFFFFIPRAFCRCQHFSRLVSFSLLWSKPNWKAEQREMVRKSCLTADKRSKSTFRFGISFFVLVYFETFNFRHFFFRFGSFPSASILNIVSFCGIGTCRKCSTQTESSTRIPHSHKPTHWSCCLVFMGLCRCRQCRNELWTVQKRISVNGFEIKTHKFVVFFQWRHSHQQRQLLTMAHQYKMLHFECNELWGK